jgi:hypothetical protein
MKLADIPPGSDLAYRCAAKMIAEQVEFELEPCRPLLGAEPEKVLELFANTPDRTVFLEDEGIRQALAFAAALVDDKLLPLPQAR